MNRHKFLAQLHEACKARTYLEIGVNDGRSLALSRVPTIAVDPAFRVTAEIHCDLQLIKATSDDFFARELPLLHFGERHLDLAFIDGMHLFEYVLRDFINVEKHAQWSTVIVFDDQLPRNFDEAARDRHTKMWTGDVYKIIPVLQRYRPDLRLAVMDTAPTGVMVVFGADPSNTTLADNYDQIIAEFLLNDPQQVPDELTSRSCAMKPESLFDALFWPDLVANREHAGADARSDLVAAIDRALAGGPLPDLGGWLPDPSVGRATEIDPSAALGEAAMTHGVRRRGAPTTRRAQAAAGGTSVRSRQSDVFGRLARRAPILRRIPGARSLVSRLR